MLCRTPLRHVMVSWLQRCLGIALLLVNVPAVYAQTPPPVIFERISTAQGLSMYAVTSIIQDRQGFLWIGTQDGLNRYDGYHFTVFRHHPEDSTTLSDSYVNPDALYEDREGRLWIGTRGGLNRRDPATGAFKQYRHDPGNSQSLSHDNVLSIYQTRAGVLWVGTEHGLNRYDPKSDRFIRYLHAPDDSSSLSGNAVTALHEDAAGTLWVGTTRGLNALVPSSPDAPDAHFARYTHDAPVARRVPHDNIYSLHADRAGILWVGTWGGGLFQLIPETGQVKQYAHDPDDPKSLPADIVVTLYEDRAGTLWVGTWGGGLGRLDPATGRFTRFVTDPENPQSLSHNQVSSIFEDHTGVLWIGTWDGLNKALLSRQFTSYTYQPGSLTGLSHPRVSEIYEDTQGALWIGTTGGGLNKLDRRTGTITHYLHAPSDPSSLSYNDVTSVWEDHAGTLWVATLGGGLNRMNRETGTFTHYRHASDNFSSLSDDRLYTVYEDTQGVLWIGTVVNGLDRFDRARGRFIHYRHDPQDANSLSHNIVWPIYEDRTGALWIGTIGGGLNRFDRATQTFTRYQYDPDDASSLSSDKILSIHEDSQGTLWVGTMGGGLNRFDRQTERFFHYTEREGLAHNNATCMLTDDAGHLWVSTTGGLSRFDPDTERFTNYDASDGLPGIIFYTGACYKTRDGELIFGSDQGVVAFRPDSLQSKRPPPPVVFTGFELFNEPARLDSAVSSVKQIRLPYDQNFIAFHFAALDFARPAANEYAYMLEGLDAEWIFARDRRYASYPNLSPGHYTFRVKAANSDGVWNEVGASLDLIITPPYWQTWWFRLLVAASLAGVLFAAYRYRVRQLLELERTRQRIAHDLHDDIGSKMSSIALRLEMVGRSGRLASEDEDLVRNVVTTSRQLVRDLRDTVWLVKTENDHLPGLVERMREAARQMLPDRPYHFEAPEALPPVLLKMELRRHLFLIYKEALHNAVRHAQASQLTIHVAYKEGHLSFSVVDDGTGFDHDNVRSGHGLRTLQARARQTGGTLVIDSCPGRGTAVRFSVLLP